MEVAHYESAERSIVSLTSSDVHTEGLELFAGILARYQRMTRVISRSYQSLFDKGSSYSAVTALFAGLFAISLLLQFFDEGRTALSRPAIAMAIVVCIGSAWFALHRGQALPRWFGMAGVAAHAVVATYVLSTAPALIEATAILQEMPLMAMYLAWFYPKQTARLSLAAYLVLVLGVSLASDGRYLGVSGSMHEVIRVTLFMVLCMELGFLWRGRVRADQQVDQLTGAISREGFSPRALKELDRAKRHGYELSLALIDLDDFKCVNDTKGHDAGDQVLANVVSEIRNSIRKTDSIYRIGGDEFVLLLPHTSENAARTMLTRLRSNAHHPWSRGVTQAIDNDTPESMVLRADKDMYADKRRA